MTFTVGKSRESEDWNFAQWGWYVKKPYWSILFDLKIILLTGLRVFFQRHAY